MGHLLLTIMVGCIQKKICNNICFLVQIEFIVQLLQTLSLIQYYTFNIIKGAFPAYLILT